MNSENDSLRAEILNNYDFFRKTGILKHIDDLQKEISNVRELLTETAPEVFSLHTISDLVNYVTGKLLDKFIPRNLIFIIKTGSLIDTLQIISFQNLKEVECLLELESLAPYEEFFKNTPGTANYKDHRKEFLSLKSGEQVDRLQPELLVPIMGLGGLFGLVIFGNKVLGDIYSEGEIEFINTLMRFTSINIQNIVNFTSASVDFKTQLYNHTYFMKRLYEESARVTRHNSQYMVMVLDIDHFKHFNDTYGHLAGDEVLRDIALLIKSSVREEDIVARFGGEEFVIMLLESSLHTGWTIAERVRKAIDNKNFSFNNHSFHVTISIGGCHVRQNRYYTPEEALKKADESLYESKKNGRNRTTFYKPGLHFIGTLLKETPHN